MSIYTIVFALVTILVLAGIAAFGFFLVKLDKWIDRKERLGAESIVKSGNKKSSAGEKTTSEPDAD